MKKSKPRFAHRFYNKLMLLNTCIICVVTLIYGIIASINAINYERIMLLKTYEDTLNQLHANYHNKQENYTNLMLTFYENSENFNAISTLLENHSVMIFQNTALPLDINSTSRLIQILKRNLTIPDIHFFINSNLMPVGILIGTQHLSEHFLNPYLDRVEFHARKEKMDLFTVIGPTVSNIEDVHKSYNLARIYNSAQHFGCRRLYCSNFADNNPELSSLWDILAKYSVHMNEMQPDEFENMLRISLDNALKASDIKTQRKIVFSAAIRIYDILKSNRQGKNPPETFIKHFAKFLSVPMRR